MPQMSGRGLQMVPTGVASMTVTDTRKRNRSYPRVFICAACHLLAQSRRTHATTCSNSCRQALHRKPELAAELNGHARTARVDLPMILDALALKELCPELLQRTVSGELTFVDCRPMMYDVFMHRVSKQNEEVAPRESDAQ